MNDATRTPEDQLQPCPWCDGTNVRVFIVNEENEKIEYVQCMDCTSCGPDHKSGRHWNKRSWRLPAAAWLRARAARQEKINEECPDHAAAYKSWRDAPLQLRMYANEVECGQ